MEEDHKETEAEENHEYREYVHSHSRDVPFRLKREVDYSVKYLTSLEGSVTSREGSVTSREEVLRHMCRSSRTNLDSEQGQPERNDARGSERDEDRINSVIKRYATHEPGHGGGEDEEKDNVNWVLPEGMWLLKHQ